MTTTLLLAAVVAVTEITITKVPANGRGVSTRWNVAVNGVPFGQIWTFKNRGEVHPFHAKTLAGEYGAFDTYAAAETFMRGAI